jgi:hypothetical protein
LPPHALMALLPARCSPQAGWRHLQEHQRGDRELIGTLLSLLVLRFLLGMNDGAVALQALAAFAAPAHAAPALRSELKLSVQLHGTLCVCTFSVAGYTHFPCSIPCVFTNFLPLGARTSLRCGKVVCVRVRWLWSGQSCCGLVLPCSGPSCRFSFPLTLNPCQRPPTSLRCTPSYP